MAEWRAVKKLAVATIVTKINHTNYGVPECNGSDTESIANSSETISACFSSVSHPLIDGITDSLKLYSYITL